MAAPDYIVISGLSRSTGKDDILTVRVARKRKRLHTYRVISVAHQLGLLGDARLETVTLEKVTEKGGCLQEDPDKKTEDNGQ